jgi:hypothetical protein
MEQAEPTRPKRPYVPPKVTPLGTVAELTRAGGSAPQGDNSVTHTRRRR